MSYLELIKELEQLTVGLFWLSESDYPWKIVSWENQPENQSTAGDSQEDSREESAKLDAQIRTQLAAINPDIVNPVQESTQIEGQELDEFFQEVVTSKDWYGEEELAECQRYQTLVSFLKNSLSGARVYQLGEVEVKVYVLGQTPSKDILGIETISVET